MTTPTDRPTGFVLIRTDGTPVHMSGHNAVLYATLTAACEAETKYREWTGKRALPTPVWSREAWATAQPTEGA